jgi:hypothetical protein
VTKTKFTLEDLDAGIAKWRSDGEGSMYTAYSLRVMYGLTKPMLRALEAAGRVVSEGRTETYEHYGWMGRDNLHRVHKFRVYYRLIKE